LYVRPTYGSRDASRTDGLVLETMNCTLASVVEVDTYFDVLNASVAIAAEFSGLACYQDKLDAVGRRHRDVAGHAFSWPTPVHSNSSHTPSWLKGYPGLAPRRGRCPLTQLMIE